MKMFAITSTVVSEHKLLLNLTFLLYLFDFDLWFYGAVNTIDYVELVA